MKEYKVVPVSTRLFSGTLNPERVQILLNEHAAYGWALARTIHETRRVMGIGRREAHFLITERDRIEDRLTAEA